MEVVLGKSKTWIQGYSSLVVVVPKVIAENLGLKPGDTVVYKLKDNAIVIEKES